ncbi:MAG: radical SAM protein [Actinomycetota bacterium]|nr:radical SAM protein [Actinomycetota bacterium]
MAEIRPNGLRWRLSAQDEDTARLFPGFSPERHVGVGEYRGLEFIHVEAARLLNRVPVSSRLPFGWTINAYRGCSHACSYCFARPTHAYLGLGVGEDFERKIVVKVNAVERVRAELASSRWRREPVAMGTNTDPYQLAEGRYHLTRGIVQALGDAANDFSILTKSTLVLRDLELLVWAASRCDVRLALSIGTLDRDVAQLTEPGAPPPQRRLAALARLRAAGLSCGVLVAPVIPGLSDADEEIAGVVSAARAAGATSVHVIPLHLRPKVREHYLDWLAAHRPDLLGLHRERFGRRSEQPHALRQRLGALAASGSDAPGSGHRQPPAPRQAPSPPRLEQLPLF